MAIVIHSKDIYVYILKHKIYIIYQYSVLNKVIRKLYKAISIIPSGELCEFHIWNADAVNILAGYIKDP
mgnify:CR=1 FL=1